MNVNVVHNIKHLSLKVFFVASLLGRWPINVEKASTSREVRLKKSPVFLSLRDSCQ